MVLRNQVSDRSEIIDWFLSVFFVWVANPLNEVLPLTSMARVCEDPFHLVELFLLV